MRFLCEKKTPPTTKESGAWFNIKMKSCQYRKSHYGDKTILRSSDLHNGIPYTGKIASLHWIRAQRVTDLPTSLWHCLFNSLRPKRNRRHFADEIFKCIFVMKMYCLLLKFRWSLFPRVLLRVFQHWVRLLLIADQATSHYLNLCSVVYSRIHASLGLNELMAVMRYVRCVTWFGWTWIYRNCRRFTIVMYWCLLVLGHLQPS